MGEKTITVKCKDFYMPQYLTLLGIMKIENGCCKDEPVLVTACLRPNDKKVIYSLQCACGMWCTNGFENLSDAINDWLRMSKKPFWREEDGKRLDITT